MRAAPTPGSDFGQGAAKKSFRGLQVVEFETPELQRPVWLYLREVLSLSLFFFGSGNDLGWNDWVHLSLGLGLRCLYDGHSH